MCSVLVSSGPPTAATRVSCEQISAEVCCSTLEANLERQTAGDMETVE